MKLLHAIICIFSCFFTGVMLLEAKCNVYPDFFCWVCAVIGIIGTIYSFNKLVGKGKENK